MAMNRQYPPPYDYDSVALLTILSVAARLSLTITVTETSDAAKTHSSNKCAYSSHFYNIHRKQDKYHRTALPWQQLYPSPNNLAGRRRIRRRRIRHLLSSAPHSKARAILFGLGHGLINRFGARANQSTEHNN